MSRGDPGTAERDGDRRDEEATSPERFEVLGRERRVAVVVDGAGRELLGVALGVGDHRRAGFRGGAQLRGRGEGGRRAREVPGRAGAERWREGCSWTA